MTGCAHPAGRLLVSREGDQVTRIFCHDCGQVLFRRDPVVAVDLGAPQMDAGDHFTACPDCGQLVDRRELESVLHHLQAGHGPERRH